MHDGTTRGTAMMDLLLLPYFTPRPLATVDDIPHRSVPAVIDRIGSRK